MSALSDYSENALLDHILGTAAYAQPTPYVALYTVTPSDTGGGTEVVGGSYARQALSMNAAAGGSANNDAEIEFTGMPAVTVVAVGIHDAVSGGNLLLWNAVGSSRTYVAGGTAKFAIGNLIAELD